MADLERERVPQFDPLVGEVIGIADDLGWPIERGEGVVFHFDGPNKRIVIEAAIRRQERVTALWREAADELGSCEPPAVADDLRTMHWFDGGLVAESRTHRADCPACELERLREQLDALKRQQWSNQNRAEVAERGHKAALARDFEQRDTIKALREQLDAARAGWEKQRKWYVDERNRVSALTGAVEHVLAHGHIGKQSERRLRAALGVVGEQEKHGE